MSLETVNAPPRVCTMRIGVPAGNVCRCPLGTAMTSQSRRSSILSAPGRAMDPRLLGGYFLISMQRGLQCMPSQRGALHARRKLRNTGKNLQLAHVGSLFIPLLAGHQAVKALEHRLGLLQRLALQALRHHRGRRLGDSASIALKGDILNHAVLLVDEYRAAVAAQGIVAFRLRGRLTLLAIIARSLGVFEYHFLVEVPQFRHQPSISFTPSMPAMSASISSLVL